MTIKTIRRSPPAALVQLVNKASGFARRFDPIRRNFVSVKPSGPIRGRVLLAHVVQGLLMGPNDPRARRHNHFLEARLLAETFIERGYAVDFIDYHNRWFVPQRPYNLFMSSRTEFEMLAAKMHPDCIKIVHLDTAHWLYNDAAALGRLHDVQKRRGVALSSYVPIGINRAIEEADYATLLGDDFDYETYSFAGKPIFQVPNPGALQPWEENKDFAACQNRFLWLGSRGLVHKGLDLVLEAFAGMPELHLTVCGPVDRDPHFRKAFHKELFETPNISTMGWVDITGPEFSDLAKRTLAHVYPTCADACCGSVVNCMHAGLIPIATRESGLRIDPSFGFPISATSVAAVQEAARHVASLPVERLAAMARKSWEEAQRVYSPDNYKRVLGDTVERILAGDADMKTPGFMRVDAPLNPGV